MVENKIQKLLQQAATNENNSSVSNARRVFSSFEQAESAFLFYKTRIFDVDMWNEVAGLTSYELFDENGQESENQVLRVNQFLRLSLKASGKYDWVRIAEINEDENALVISVKPTYDPTDKTSQKAKTSHFFTAESSNNFCLIKDHSAVSFYVIGLDETTNIDETKNPLETVRNIATSNLGSYLRIQKSEWETFCKNFLDYYKSDNA